MTILAKLGKIFDFAEWPVSGVKVEHGFDQKPKKE